MMEYQRALDALDAAEKRIAELEADLRTAAEQAAETAITVAQQAKEIERLRAWQNRAVAVMMDVWNAGPILDDPNSGTVTRTFDAAALEAMEALMSEVVDVVAAVSREQTNDR